MFYMGLRGRSSKSISREILKLKLINQKNTMLVDEKRKRMELEQELKSLKNPHSQAFKSNLQRGLLFGGRKTLQFLDKITRPEPVRRSPSRKIKRRR